MGQALAGIELTPGGGGGGAELYDEGASCGGLVVGGGAGDLDQEDNASSDDGSFTRWAEKRVRGFEVCDIQRIRLLFRRRFHEQQVKAISYYKRFELSDDHLAMGCCTPTKAGANLLSRSPDAAVYTMITH